MATYNGQVTGGGLNLRESASISSSALVQIPNDTQIVVSDYSGNTSWYCTTYSGKSGFVMKQYVNILGNVASRSCTVTGGGLNLRAYPSTSAPSPVQIPDGTALAVQTHNDTWSSTTFQSHSGFVMTQYLTINSGGSEEYSISAKVDTDKHGVGGDVKLRAQASQSSDVVTNIPDQATIYVKSMSGEWLAAKYNSYTGYIMAKFVAGSDAYNGSTGGGSSGSTLQKGSTGSEVLALQNRLTALRYYCGTADGDFGQKTYLAVKYFQERNSLTTDGTVGTNTWNKLNSSTAVQGVDSSILNWKAKDRPVVYYQNRSFWASYPYDAKNTSTVETVGSSACGPTSMAMVISTLLKKAVTPPVLSDWALDNNYRDHNGQNGTAFGFFSSCANAFGLTYGGSLSAKTTATFNTIANWCNSGGLAIINAYSASPYTNAGHYIVCYKVENNVVYIQESNYNNRNIPNHTVSEWINTSNGNWFGNIALIK